MHGQNKSNSNGMESGMCGVAFAQLKMLGKPSSQEEKSKNENSEKKNMVKLVWQIHHIYSVVFVEKAK